MSRQGRKSRPGNWKKGKANLKALFRSYGRKLCETAAEVNEETITSPTCEENKREIGTAVREPKASYEALTS